jgi:hypothetical protein
MKRYLLSLLAGLAWGALAGIVLLVGMGGPVRREKD